MTKSMPIRHLIPDCLTGGLWVDIGHLSAIRLVTSKGKSMIEHYFEGKVKSLPLSWLVDDMPILMLILENKCEKVIA
jgi:hypothetical protein